MLKSYFFLFILLITISACNDEKSKKTPVNIKVSETVKHYICSNNCENSGSDIAGNCPVCQNPYIHNAAFHGDDLLKSGPLNVPSNATQPINNTPTQTTAPAQNAAGVYHYTCSNGCYGGSGAATNCTSCGSPLAHNQAYHN
jgi:hypothetical protein